MIISMACLILGGIGIWYFISAFDDDIKGQGRQPSVLKEIVHAGILLIVAKQVFDRFGPNHQENAAEDPGFAQRP